MCLTWHIPKSGATPGVWGGGEASIGEWGVFRFFFFDWLARTFWQVRRLCCCRYENYFALCCCCGGIYGKWRAESGDSPLPTHTDLCVCVCAKRKFCIWNSGSAGAVAAFRLLPYAVYHFCKAPPFKVPIIPPSPLFPYPFRWVILILSLSNDNIYFHFRVIVKRYTL